MEIGPEKMLVTQVKTCEWRSPAKHLGPTLPKEFCELQPTCAITIVFGIMPAEAEWLPHFGQQVVYDTGIPRSKEEQCKGFLLPY